jgi:glycerol-3-phosphate dehydrogenase
MTLLKTQVLIVGGGATGAGLARDLSLRGVPCLLVERGDIAAGASGANHGLLHSGARYVAKDPQAALECAVEGAILKKVAAGCIEDTGGLFVAVAGDDERYVADFPSHCHTCGVACEPLALGEAREMEPVLSEKLIAAFKVPDAAIDPFKLVFENIDEALSLGADVRPHTRVTGFRRCRRGLEAALLRDMQSGAALTVEAAQFVNAAGAWAAEVAALAGLEIPMLYSKGSLLVSEPRLARRVINRLRSSADADILVPGGTVSLLGTTSVRLDRLEDCRPTIPEIDRIIDAASKMVPALAATRFIRAYAGVRPLVGAKTPHDDRAVSRGFALMDHAAEGCDNLVTITGGKLTTYRKMAEKTADLVCAKLGVAAACRTAVQPLAAGGASRWAAPGLAPRLWLKAQDPDDLLLCECEMVPQSAVDEIVDAIRRQKAVVDIRAIGLRSRIGKGTCQGAFCAVRLAAYLCDRGLLGAGDGPADIRAFLASRWKGLRPVLWGRSLVQEELQEALHCGLFGLEL